ncbi:MAG TPA: delta-60 repeat domain-containing protein [Chthoniobacterales bacterium]|nr:delta-60 repeat domain-containing protein [Chthoniobacterales bacterium]
MKRFDFLSQTTAAALMLLAMAFANRVLAQSALDGFDPSANGEIRIVVVQPDGKILIGGDFTTLAPNGGGAVTRNRVARLNPDGSLDTTFDPNANSSVYSIAVQPDGKILIGGNFSELAPNGGAAMGRLRLARLNPDGTVDTAFDANLTGTDVRAIALQADGKVLAGGLFSTGGGNNIARFDSATGLADPSFYGNANERVQSIAVQADGKILAGGPFTSIGGQTRIGIGRLDATTGLADSFDPNANSSVLTIAVQADGKILVGGQFTRIGVQTRIRIARLDATTGLADSFDPFSSGAVHSIAVQADGKILAGGLFETIGGQSRKNIARLNASSGLADSFDPNTNGTVQSIAVQTDGKVLVGGFFSAANSIGGQTRNHIARLEIDGRLDQTLNLGSSGSYVTATAVQPDGKLLIGGVFSNVGGMPRNNIARLNRDGTLDTAFDPNANGEVRAIAVQADGKILVGGDFTSIGGQNRNVIARLDGTTGLADSFDANATGFAVWAIAVQTDGRILAGGDFTSMGGQPRNHIARLDPATGLADSFDPNSSNIVSAIALQGDGKILVGGPFYGPSSIGGQARKCIARLDPATGLADSFDPSADGFLTTVNAIVVQSDGKILMGGAFTSIGGQMRNRIARVDPDTGLADSFNPNAKDTVLTIAVQADGKVLAGGLFFGTNSIGGQTRSRMARLDATTGLADSFDPNPNQIVAAIALLADGKIFVGGNFLSIGGQPQRRFARLSNDTAALQNLAVTQTSITWTRAGSSPQLSRVFFDYSVDNVNYFALGDATASGANWTLTGLNLPDGQNIYIRGRGYYRTGQDNGSDSITEAVRNAFITDLTPGLVSNVATRLPVGTGDNALIEGFIVHGQAGTTKKIMVRALGPFLAQFGITDALGNPTLEIRDWKNVVVATNNDWKTTQVGGLITGDQLAEISGSGLAPSDDLESAIIANLAPGNYTAMVRGLGDTTGTGIVDAYDISAGSPARLVNIATRGLIQPGDKLMIAGFIIQNAPVRAAIRAIGPSLIGRGIANALPDTTLELRDQNGAILIENDNWKSNAAQKHELESNNLQPSHDLEAALITTIPPGQYTAQVRGKGDASGIGVVEVYFLQ